MTIDLATGRFDWMTWDPGPPERVYPGRNTLEYYIPHDMGGYYRPGSYTPMRDPARQASWPYTVGEDACYQHYPIWAPCWTSGSEHWNRRGIAPETVRTVRPLRPSDTAEPFTTAQVGFHLLAIADIYEYRARIGLPRIQYARSLGTVKWHSEVSPVVTLCPSGRAEPLAAMLERFREDPMTPEEKQAFDALRNEHDWMLRLVFGSTDRMKALEELQRLPVEERVERFERNDGPIGVRLANLEAKTRATGDAVSANASLLDGHIANHPSGLSRDTYLKLLQAQEDYLLGEAK